MPMHQRRELRKVVELCIVSNFVEVWLARDGHKNPVGINFLEKVQMPHLSSIYGAMLAGVGCVLMVRAFRSTFPEFWTHSRVSVLPSTAWQSPARTRMLTHPCALIPPITSKVRCLFSIGRAF